MSRVYSPGQHVDARHNAATKIQAFVRGYLERMQLKERACPQPKPEIYEAQLAEPERHKTLMQAVGAGSAQAESEKKKVEVENKNVISGRDTNIQKGAPKAIITTPKATIAIATKPRKMEQLVEPRYIQMDIYMQILINTCV
jgi:hypothetical protein